MKLLGMKRREKNMIYKEKIHLLPMVASKMDTLSEDKTMLNSFSINSLTNHVVVHLVVQVIVVHLVIHLQIHLHKNLVRWILMKIFSELVLADLTNHEIQTVHKENAKELNRLKRVKQLNTTFVLR